MWLVKVLAAAVKAPGCIVPMKLKVLSGHSLQSPMTRNMANPMGGSFLFLVAHYFFTALSSSLTS